MPKPHIIGNGKNKDNFVENIIYNGTDYAYSAKVISSLFSPSEIIAELAAIKQRIQEKGDKSELRHFIYNSRLLINELIKAKPNDANYLQIQQYVMNPNRYDRKQMRENFAKQAANGNQPDILQNFHSLMNVSRRKEPLSVKREMEHAWQSIRRVSRRNQVAKENEIVISRVDSRPSVKPQPPSTPPPTPTVVAPPQTTPEPKKVQQKNLINAIRAVLKRSSVANRNQNQGFVIQRRDPEITRQPTAVAAIVPKQEPESPPIVSTQQPEIPPPLPKPKLGPSIADTSAELIATEKSYINSINVLTDENIKQVMRDYLKKSKEYQSQGYAKPDELEAYLRTVGDLATKHQLILQSFQKGDYKGGVEQLKLLQNAYSDYMIASSLKIPPDLKVTAAAKPGFNNSIDSILSQPFQRITRYPMLLTEMSKSKDIDDNAKSELQGLTKLTSEFTKDVNTAKAHHDDKKDIEKLINQFEQKTTTDGFRKILEILHKSAFDVTEKKQLLKAIDISKLNTSEIHILQQYAQKEINPEFKSFLNHKATAGQLVRILETDIPKDLNSPEAAFLKSLRTQITIQSSVRQNKDSSSNMTILTEEALIAARSAFLHNGGRAQDCEKMAERYRGVVDFVQKDMKAKIYAQTPSNTNILSSFEQKKQSVPEESKKKEAAAENVKTPPRKNSF